MAHDLFTDDEGRRLEYQWDGPPELASVWVWNARIQTQAGTLMLTFVFWLVYSIVLPSWAFAWVPFVPVQLTKTVVVLAAGVASAVVVAMIVAPKVTKEAPLRYWRQVLTDELHAPHAPTSGQPPAMPAISVPRALWDTDANRTTRRPLNPTAATGPRRSTR